MEGFFFVGKSIDKDKQVDEIVTQQVKFEKTKLE
jgi:hypothetical protein